MNSTLIFVLLLLPLSGSLVGYFTGKRSKHMSVLSTLITFCIAVFLLLFHKEDTLFTWYWLPGFQLSVMIDLVSLLLISLVCLVAFFVQFFSLEYMREDSGMKRYYLKLGFFISAMIGLLMADSLMLLFVFWELVGVASYLLIGFWYKKDGIPKSARTAFMVNRVADAALLAGIILVYDDQSTLAISSLSTVLPLIPSVLIVVGAFGKSAQFPFSGWLTKAMVGPTPVSALIHAATMVAAGVYLLYRLAPFLHPKALMVSMLVGTFTAFYAALCAMIQFDIKKVLAYSTISQLGYMVLGIGVGARESVLFHLFTHAFFKAGLFLGAAAIISYLHAVSEYDAQDLRKMGGLKKRMPWTFIAFLTCSLALAGLPFFSGFMSKDGILLAAWNFASEHGSWSYIIPDFALFTSLLTAFYSGRIVILVFFGTERYESKSSSFSEPIFYRIPLVVLAIFSIWLVHHWNPFAHHSLLFGWLDLHKQATISGGELIPFIATSASVAGLVLAFSFFKPRAYSSEAISSVNPSNSFGGRLIFEGLHLNKLYDVIGEAFVSMSKKLTHLDQKVIDLFLAAVAVTTVVFSKMLALADRFFVDGPVNLFAKTSSYIGKRLAGMSSRDGQTQIMWLLFIVIVILTFLVS